MGMPVKGMIPSSVMPAASHFPDLHFPIVEAIAEAWARMDNVLRQYRVGAEENPFQIHGGLRYAYLHDAATLLREMRKAGLDVTDFLPPPPPPPLPPEPSPVLEPSKPKRVRKIKLTPHRLRAEEAARGELVNG